MFRLIIFNFDSSYRGSANKKPIPPEYLKTVKQIYNDIYNNKPTRFWHIHINAPNSSGIMSKSVNCLIASFSGGNYQQEVYFVGMRHRVLFNISLNWVYYDNVSI